VQHGQPGFTGGVKSLWSDPRQPTSLSSVPILSVYVQEVGQGGRLGSGAQGSAGGNCGAALEAAGQCFANSAYALGTHAGHPAEATIIRSSFQFLQRLDPELFMDAAGCLEADTGQSNEQLLGPGMASKSL